MDYYKESLRIHKEKKGKLEIKSKVSLGNKNDLSIAYTPGVAEPCRKIHKNPKDAFKYTIKGNSVAVVTNGTAVLGLGNIGAKAALPVMEGKCLLFKKFANIDAYPICLDTEDSEEIVKTVKLISPGFGGINLEDIKAPDCFEIEKRLIKELDIPVFHDDQHGTAIVVLAALINALKLVNKKIAQTKIVINGAGAAGIAIANLLLAYGAGNIILIDSIGTIYEGRKQLNPEKQKIAQTTNQERIKGGLKDVIKGSNVFIGVSVANALKRKWVTKMAPKSIIFAMANPMPEIMPDKAEKAGAFIVATGRSDFKNQINNVLVFPGVFRGLLDAKAEKITEEMKLSVAQSLAGLIKNPNPNKIIPTVFNKRVVKKIAGDIKKMS